MTKDLMRNQAAAGQKKKGRRLSTSEVDPKEKQRPRTPRKTREVLTHAPPSPWGKGCLHLPPPPWSWLDRRGHPGETPEQPARKRTTSRRAHEPKKGAGDANYTKEKEKTRTFAVAAENSPPPPPSLIVRFPLPEPLFLGLPAPPPPPPKGETSRITHRASVLG